MLEVILKFVYIGSRKLFLKPASFQKKLEANGSSAEQNSINVFNNPFLKCDEKDEETLKNKETASDSAKNNSKEKSTDDLFKPAKNNLNLFTNATTDNSSNFVFGQNLRERVVIVSSFELWQHITKHIKKLINF